MLLTQLIPQFLPTPIASAQNQTNACTGTTVQFTHQTANSAHAVDDQVTIPKELVDQSVFAVNWGASYKDAKALVQIIQDEFDLSFGFDAANQHQKIMDAFRGNYEKAIPTAGTVYGQLPYDEIVHAMFDAALQTPGLREHVPAVWKYISTLKDTGYAFDVRPLKAPDVVAASARRYSLGERLIASAPETLKKVFDCAQRNPAFAGAYDQQHKLALKSSIRDSAAQVIAQNPNLPILKAIRERIGVDGALTISINELKELSKAEFTKIHLSIEDMQQTLSEIDAKQNVLVDYVNNQQEKERMQALAAAKAAEHRLKLDAAQSSIFIIHTLVDFIDPKLATQIATVGTSALQIAESVNGWLDAVAGLSSLDKVGSLSTVVMTGNVLGAVMNIVSLFGNSGPTPDQMILEEIGKLRQDVSQLRSEMHSRFDRVDKELNTIYSTMQDRFNLIDVQLGKLNIKLDELQQALVELDVKLSRIERNNFEFLNALGRRPLLEAINGGLAYQQTTGLPMPYQPEFVNFANTLHAWGTIHAFDALEAGPSQTDFSDSNVLAVLNAYPLDSNINYLNGWLVAHGQPGITNKRLANSRDWLLASRAYSQLGIEWPEHMRRYDEQRQTQLDGVGADIQAAMLKMSTLNTLSGTVGNQLLFGTVITNYRDKLDRLDTTIRPMESAFVGEVQAIRLQRNEPFDLYGGIDQPLAYQSPETKVMTCDNPNGINFSAPNNLSTLIANFNRYNLAEYLKLGKFKLCVSGDYVNTQRICHQKPEPQCDILGQFKVTIDVHFENISIEQRSITGEEMELVEEDPLLVASQRWTGPENWKALFEAQSDKETPSPQESAQRAELLNTTTTKLNAQLAAYQHELYGRITNELTNGKLRPFVIETAGAKALLDSFVTLGLSRAVADDDFVHAMLFGNQQLVDDSQVIATYSLSATQPITNSSLMINPRLLIEQTAGKRTTAFEAIINQYLAAITAKTHVEELDYIANTRRELDLSVRIAQVEEQPTPSVTPTPTPAPTPISSSTPAPYETNHIYLPLIRK